MTSVSHTVLAWLPGDIVRFKVTWTTNVRADAADQLIVTPPSGPGGTVSDYTISSDGKTHSATYEGHCVPKALGSHYTCVVSSRLSCGVGTRTGTYQLQIPYCVD